MPLDTIRTRLKQRRLDALLVTQPENRRYLSGYTANDSSIAESAGVLLIKAKGEPLLLTDARFALQAEREAPGFAMRLYQRGLLALLKQLLPRLAIRRLAFEPHWMLHSTAEALLKMTGALGIEAVPVSGLAETMRRCKTKTEIERIRAAVLLNEQVFRTVYSILRPGQTERQVADRLEMTMRQMGAEGPAFDTIVGAGPNGALPHAVPSDRPLGQGEPIVIDMGLRLAGYCSDMTRTVVLGEPDDKTKEIIRIVRRAQLAATQVIRAGCTGREADRAARQVISAAGYGKYFGHGLGHGVGLAVHEAPALNRRNRGQLAPGMVVTVEPGIYLPEWGGVRLENMVVVQKAGCELLNQDTTFLDID
ncbi:MAG: peptidase M24 [Desulfobacterales bacterium CG2_30_60_27]|nr:MAG: peptidase M24 [Desulfobacterales bacterium CG2_30_60_27]